ncbi:MAG: hypothetical protein K8J31_00040, partial [Anaerolineae bacterium]|nr:hypothetical protein [Anaerolineae bacterium]
MKYAACVVMMMVLWAGSPGFAQETSPTLSEAGGAQLAQAISTPLMSFAFEGSAALAVTGLDSFALNASVSGSGAVDLAAHALRLTLDGPLVLGSTQAIPVSAEIRLLNDVLYLNPVDGWQAREDAPTAIASVIGEFTGLSADTQALAAWNLIDIDGLNGLLTALAAADSSTFITAERLDDEGRS